MPMRVKVRAVIWVGDQIVVDDARREGGDHVRLPGGRLNDRESAIDALKREVREEVGLDVEVGPLLCVAEVVSGVRLHDLELVFQATPTAPVDPAGLELIDPSNPGVKVLPAVLEELLKARENPERFTPRWLGNVYIPLS